MFINTDDLAFVEKVVNRDCEAAELFFCRCQLWAGQLARLSRVPEQEWGDLAHETLLTALGQMRRGLFRGESSFQTWIEKIIRGKIADYWRLHRNDQALTPVEDPLGGYQDISLIQSRAFQKTDYELRLAVRQALRAMPEQHAIVLLLNLREGYSTAEIGHRLDLPQGTVGRKLFEAKRLFRRFFGDPPETRRQGPAGVRRRNSTTPAPVVVSATPLKTSGVWLKSV